MHRVHCFGAIPPTLSVLGFWSISFGTLEVQVYSHSTESFSAKGLERDSGTRRVGLLAAPWASKTEDLQLGAHAGVVLNSLFPRRGTFTRKNTFAKLSQNHPRAVFLVTSSFGERKRKREGEGERERLTNSESERVGERERQCEGMRKRERERERERQRLRVIQREGKR